MSDGVESSTAMKKITLKSSDNETFEIEKAVALESQKVKHLIDNDCADESGIPIPNVTGKMLDMVIEYCKKRVSSDEKPSEDEIKKWDDEFVKVAQDTLSDRNLAANNLNINSLLHLTCKTVADMINGMTLEEIRKTFNIKIDYTPEEEE